MNEGETLTCTREYRDGSVQIEHRDARGCLLAIYVGYYRHGGCCQLYPARGERHTKVTLGGMAFSPRLIS